MYSLWKRKGADMASSVNDAVKKFNLWAKDKALLVMYGQQKY